jgi:hypothetical protein
VLTGWETVPAAFVATAWQHRAAWGATLDDVRLLALGLVAAGAGPGRRVAVDRDLTLELAVLAAGAVAVLDGSGADMILPSGLREAGRALDGAEPDAFERAWQAVDPGDVAVVAGATFTHANLVAAVRSLAAATGAGPGRTVEADVDAPAAALLAPLTGAVPGAGDIVLRRPDALVVPGHAGVVSLGGRPLPGVTIAVGDDGRTRVRSDGVAPSCLVDGWLEAA